VLIRVPNQPPGPLDLGPHPWEREGYVPVTPGPGPDCDVDPDLAVEGYHVLRRDIAWFRAEVKGALEAGDAMRLRELLELFVWGQDLRKAMDFIPHQSSPLPTATAPTPPPPPPAPTPVQARPKAHARRRKVASTKDEDWVL
jgi:hypothetical protein